MIALAGRWMRRLDDEGRPVAAAEPVGDVAAIEAAERPRWLWGAAEQTYLPLLEAGVRVRRCHDLDLVEAMLAAHEGNYGTVAARVQTRTRQPAQGVLFGDDPAEPSLDELIDGYPDQRRRIDKTTHPGRFRLLVAAESASALVATEMGHLGLPWDAQRHDELLLALLGEPSPMGGSPRKLADLARAIGEALDAPGVHPDSPAELLKALRRAGLQLRNTRSWTLKQLDHPVVPLLVEYRELYRIWTAHGWSWRDQWVHNGRFRPLYIPSGVVSGRWATRGGGALQIPKAVRGAAHAIPGWKLVVADAGQLEPRILAAVSGDLRLAKAASGKDLYADLAAESFKGDRAMAKVALLGAMYGQTGGNAAPALAQLRNSYPLAWAYVEAAARAGEGGGLVRSWLGRTSPPSNLERSWEDEGASGRAWGRFTRNFVIQATAAEWAATLLALLREGLWGTAAELVFFQHDEVIVHCPEAQADQVTQLLHDCALRTGSLLFGSTPVRFPLHVSVVDSYGDAAH